MTWEQQLKSVPSDPFSILTLHYCLMSKKDPFANTNFTTLEAKFVIIF